MRSRRREGSQLRRQHVSVAQAAFAAWRADEAKGCGIGVRAHEALEGGHNVGCCAFIVARYLVFERMWSCLLPRISSWYTSRMRASIELYFRWIWYAIHVGWTNVWKRSTISL